MPCDVPKRRSQVCQNVPMPITKPHFGSNQVSIWMGDQLKTTFTAEWRTYFQPDAIWSVQCTRNFSDAYDGYFLEFLEILSEGIY